MTTGSCVGEIAGGRGTHRAARADGLVQVVGHLAEPDDVGSQGLVSAGRARDEDVLLEVLGVDRARAACLAAQTQELAVHGEDLRAGALVKVVDVLRDEGQRPAGGLQHLLRSREGQVRGVGLHAADLLAAQLVEAPDELPIPLPGLGRRDLLEAMPLPEPAGVPVGVDAGVRRDPGPVNTTTRGALTLRLRGHRRGPPDPRCRRRPR